MFTDAKCDLATAYAIHFQICLESESHFHVNQNYGRKHRLITIPRPKEIEAHQFLTHHTAQTKKHHDHSPHRFGGPSMLTSKMTDILLSSQSDYLSVLS
jgi:hypothetical protein